MSQNWCRLHVSQMEACIRAGVGALGAQDANHEQLEGEECSDDLPVHRRPQLRTAA